MEGLRLYHQVLIQYFANNIRRHIMWCMNDFVVCFAAMWSVVKTRTLLHVSLKRIGD